MNRYIAERASTPAWTLLIALMAVPSGSTGVNAHPHVWVAVETTVIYENAAVTGLRHTWTFDDLYTAQAVQGLDTNGDGTYDRQELAELAKVNMDGLKEFAYFTFAKLGETDVALGEPTDAWLEHKDGTLALHFTVPLRQPVLAEADGFSFSVYDPSFFIAFDLAKDNPIRLAEQAPQGCTAEIGIPKSDQIDLSRLGESFAQELGDYAGFGLSMAKTVSIRCAKS